MKEGSTEAPIRHPLAWAEPEFVDPQKIDDEMRRVFDICHGCRRCFNLCDSFPRLFDLIDDSETGELDTVNSGDFAPVVEACTLCDMCFMTKCPYVPPHDFELDFPHLMLRYRASRAAQGESDFVADQLGEMDRNGKLARPIAPLVNWGAKRSNTLTRIPMEKVARIDRDAELPKFASRTFVMQARDGNVQVNREAPAFGRKAVLYATCFVNYNNPDTGIAAHAALAHNGVDVIVDYPACCGMPFLEQGNIKRVAGQAEKVSKRLLKWVDDGYDIIALTASCGLMLKFEWPLILPESDDVKRLAEATYDIDEYMVGITKNEGLAEGLKPLDGGVTVHLACHARAQNMGPKSAEMLRLIPDTEVSIVERCSGHGGTFGVLKETHGIAKKFGQTTVRNIAKAANPYVASDCPLAAKHLLQGLEEMEPDGTVPERTYHPIEILAKAYGLWSPND